MSYWSVYQHIESGRRIAFPYRSYFSRAFKAMLNFRYRAKCACEQVQFKTFIRLSYDDDKIEGDVHDFFTSAHLREFLNRLKSLYRMQEKNAKFDYCWRVDYGEERGRPHWHLLTTEDFIPIKVLEHEWRYGYCWIVRVKNSKVASRYIGKYMAKNEVILGRKFRTYGFSTTNIKKLPRVKQWKRVYKMLEQEFLVTEVDDWNAMLIMPGEDLDVFVKELIE